MKSYETPGGSQRPLSLSDLNVNQLAARVKDIGAESYRVTQILEEVVYHPGMSFAELVRALGRKLGDGLDELTLTTNGTQLAEFAADLFAAGVRRVNVSLDTLDRQTFARLARRDSLPQVLEGIAAARAAGLAEAVAACYPLGRWVRLTGNTFAKNDGKWRGLPCRRWSRRC